ncbi:MAG TPA: alpha/beta hydrolase [Candidatus Cybelea sp.]|nr:alpha/beta hydrolase [Candidatus Cybelea sp.]
MISRRSALAGAGAALFAAPARALADVGQGARRSYGPGHLVAVRGKHLYVEISGPADAPALVYIHGGPGTGSYDFGLYQKQRLSRHLRLIQFDQRGALRSDAVGDHESFTLGDLVEDTEALRKALGIERWSFLCQSFGGLIAVRYALAYPDAVQKALFNNPTIDIGSSCHNQLLQLAGAYRKLGDRKKYGEVLAAYHGNVSGRDAWLTFSRLGRDLPFDARMDSYVHNLPSGYFTRWMVRSGLGKAFWYKGSGPSQITLWNTPGIFDGLETRLHELRKPILLMKGRYDFVTAPDQVAAFARQARTRIVIFEKSGHLPEAEEPDRFAEVVSDFVLATP